MNLIYYIGIFPLLSFFLLTIFQRFFLKKIVSIISIFSILMSFFLFLYVIYDYIKMYSTSKVFFIPLLNWMYINNYGIKLNFLVDFFSLSMLGTVILISLCIYLYSLWYMKDSLEYTKYFIYMNLFVSFMIFFVLSSNLIIMFCIWELVGICSYLLIGFYFKQEKNGYSAIKSFLMTRFSDIFFLISIFLILLHFNTTDFFILKYFTEEIVFLNYHTNYLFWISFCLIVASIGKSAQIPLHTWLIGAMVGPTPASALIHAATMVAMGIYLIIRVHFLFFYNTNIMFILSLIGCFTLLISSFSAIFEKNIKRILAFSTISQIGYMFLALGSKNIKGTFLHLICHAFFKSLLFLSAGSIIKHTNNEQNIFKMGCLYKKLPFIYMTFLTGIISLISFPFITSSFYSKGDILFNIFDKKEILFLFCSFLGILFTSIYSCRMFFFIFHGQNKSNFIAIKKNFFHDISLFILCIGCTPITWYFISNVFYKIIFTPVLNGSTHSVYLEYISFGITTIGFIIFFIFYLNQYLILKKYCLESILYPVYSLILNNWFFDMFYFYLIIQPYYMISNYLNSKKFFYIERFFLNLICFFKSKLFQIKSIDIVYHIRWYIFCLTACLLIIFINKNNYI
ncbi:NADH-quinone oxidoreductase subunit L [Buchnera aphidicola (Cinara piceae)]|uniref:NADH-quinone oxidoreductase subunit L n=1 Tax=Buchnera aphidicola (Cinara piceae) TaxID=1660043 RepID=A0A803FTJ7_9GAMM|nr:NADH-quinone oxidoreductase subunit L [Buchnera aphidicola]VFP88066.1 NADH-quinone oxidoreductase subunit L [Buchnera aphidicola (Cinara piceae)]